MQWFFDLIDRLTQRTVRQVAHSHGRRSLITRLGVALVGGLSTGTWAGAAAGAGAEG